jgi:epoxide hydrolase-like predicted phosphatase
MIKALIFDFAGVITTTDAYWQWISENIKDLESKKAVFQKLSEDVDRAAITHEEFLAGFAKAAGIRANEVWPKIKTKNAINKELVSLIQELKKEYKIGLLSNFTYPWLSELLEEFNLYKYFDHVLISSQEKIIKPDPRIFRKMLALLGTEAKRSVFFDDKEANVRAAEALDIHSFLFTTNEKFKKDLNALGLIV